MLQTFPDCCTLQPSSNQIAVLMVCYREIMAQDKRGTMLLRSFDRVKQQFSLCCQSARSRRCPVLIDPGDLSWGWPQPPTSQLSISDWWTDWFLRFMFYPFCVSPFISFPLFYQSSSVSLWNEHLKTFHLITCLTCHWCSLPFCFLSAESLADAKCVQTEADALNFPQWHQESALCQKLGHK